VLPVLLAVMVVLNFLAPRCFSTLPLQHPCVPLSAYLTCTQAGVVSDGVYSGEVGLQVVPPLGSLKFIVEPRVLPLIGSMEVRLDSSIKDMPGG
jgi:hypothetical protein